jgi:hypothetical protein
VSSLHKVIRENNVTMVIKHLRKDPSLLIQPNSIGWTALHVCSASFELPFDTWKWILTLIPSGFDILELRNDAGQNCVDHFFRLFLNPLEWQRPEVKDAALELNESIQLCLEQEQCLHELKLALMNMDETNSIIRSNAINPRICSVISFWRRLQLLMNCVSPSILHSLSRTACPREVALLAMKLYPGTIYQRDCSGNLPLHLACSHDGAEVAILECLLDQASVVDTAGRWPLHIALMSGKTWYRGKIDKLWNAYPHYGGPTYQGLPAFVWAALPDPKVVQRETQRLASERPLWRFLPAIAQQRELKEAASYLELDHLTTVYEVLRAAPNVLLAFCR